MMGFLAELESDHEFVKPKREILSPQDLVNWPKSEAYNEYVEFIMKLNTAVMSKKLSYPISLSQNLTSLLGVLTKLSEWIDQTPAIDQPQRFGNKAFKTWFMLVTDHVQDLLRSVFDESFYPALEEITTYLIESFGNSTRIDYGSGHEMNFVLFMYCLFRTKILDWTDVNDVLGSVLKLFNSYITLVRKLQLTYRMEPAGSHGAWSLDDYQFIPFIWGSAQLIRNDQIEPNHMTDEKVVQESKDEFMFFGCIAYIMQVKTGPFHEHSCQLWNISGTESWTKVNNGLIKMYKAEIISKFPIIQHTLFGSLLSIKPATTSQNFGAFRAPSGPGPRPQLSGFSTSHPTSQPLTKTEDVKVSANINPSEPK